MDIRQRYEEAHMLILNCGIKDNLRLGSEIAITILDVHGGQVRLGIDAPRHIEVHREEVYRRIKGLEDDDEGLLAASNRRLFRRKRRIIHNPTPY